jgi:hypothetical protein
LLKDEPAALLETGEGVEGPDAKVDPLGFGATGRGPEFNCELEAFGYWEDVTELNRP